MEMLRNELVKDLVDSFSLDSRIAGLLVERGITDKESARSFLYPSREDFEDPFVLTGMQDAVARIRRAIEEKEKIVVYGDYDCDGITATAILCGYLASIGADVSYFIPSRFDTGYGLSVEALEEIAETYYPDLIITVDCGITSVAEAEYLQDVLAIDLIVTDHHMLPEVLPNTIVVDPKLDPTTSSTDLCGAGVAFKLVQALGGADVAWNYIELAAIATVADVVPLTGENRLIVSLGLKKINSREVINKGLRLLIKSIELKNPVDVHAVGFQIAPRINSLGRISDATEAVRLFIGEEYVELQGIVEKMNRGNEIRRSLLDETYREAREMMRDYDLSLHRIIMLYKKEWSSGIIGLVCGWLRNDYNRPVILLCGEDDLSGSGRSVEGVDLYQTMKSAEKHLIRFGGHKSAAGLSVKMENFIAARNAMDDYLAATYPDEIYTRSKAYDFEIAPEDVTMTLADSIELMEPFGMGNPKPLFKFSSADVSLVPFGNGENLKGRLNSGADIIVFGRGYLADGLRVGYCYDYLCECGKNEFKNIVKVQMKIVSEYPVGRREGDDLPLFNQYLRANLYHGESSDYSAIAVEELGDSLYDDRFSTLYLALSSGSASMAMNHPALKGKLLITYGKTFDAPWNEVMVAPIAEPVGFRKIVVLDSLLTTAYLARLAKASGAEIVVVKNNYPYKDVFRDVDLSPDAILSTYKNVERLIRSGGGATSPMDLAGRVAYNDEKNFLIRFYILYDLGAISIGKGFSLSMRPIPDLTNSLFYKRIMMLKRTL